MVVVKRYYLGNVNSRNQLRLDDVSRAGFPDLLSRMLHGIMDVQRENFI